MREIRDQEPAHAKLLVVLQQLHSLATSVLGYCCPSRHLALARRQKCRLPRRRLAGPEPVASCSVHLAVLYPYPYPCPCLDPVQVQLPMRPVAEQSAAAARQQQRNLYCLQPVPVQVASPRGLQLPRQQKKNPRHRGQGCRSRCPSAKGIVRQSEHAVNYVETAAAKSRSQQKKNQNLQGRCRNCLLQCAAAVPAGKRSSAGR